MGIPTAVPSPPCIIRLSPTAWTLALHAASAGQTEQAEDAPGARATRILNDLHASAREDGWAELYRQGVAVGTELTPRWLEPLQQLLAPVILLRLSSAYHGMGTNSDFMITGDRGVCVHRRSSREPTGEEATSTTGPESLHEVALFDTEHVWGAISRVLPPFAEFRADSAHARASPGGKLLHLPLTPSEAAAVVPEEAILSAVLTTRAEEDRQFWAGRWSVSEGTLYSVRTTGGALILAPRPPGHVAREIISALAGAYEFIAGAAAGA